MLKELLLIVGFSVKAYFESVNGTKTEKDECR